MPGGSDDFANALCGALVTATARPRYGMLDDAVLDIRRDADGRPIWGPTIGDHIRNTYGWRC